MYSVCASNSCCLQGSGMHQQKDQRWADLFKNGVSQKANGLSRSIMTFPHSTWHYWGIPHWTSPFAYWSLISCSCFHIFIDTYFIGKLHASLISLMLLPISAGDSDLGSFGFLGLGPIFRSFQVAACERWQSKLFICQKSSGWWLTYPSEKWWSSSVGMMIFPIITIIIIYIYGEMKHVPNHQPVIVSNGDSEPIPPSGAASTARKSMERLDRATPFSPRNGVAHGRSTIEGRATTNEWLLCQTSKQTDYITS